MEEHHRAQHRRRRAMKIRASHGLDASLTALATLTAALPISTLLAQPTWLRGTVILLAVIALSGIGARSLALRGWQVLTVQLVCSVLAASAIYGRGHLWHGLPTLETLGFANRLVREAVSSAQHYAAPAPTTPGLMFVVGCSMGLAALAVDYLAVTCGSPSLAGLPLLTVYLASVANRGATLPFLFFLAPAAIWLILVTRADSSILRRWSNAVALASTPAPQRLESRGVFEHASVARMLGVVALVAAVAVPVVLPQTHPKFLGSGLGRSTSATGSGTGVGFSQSLDLGSDLKSRSRVPVLQYTTTDNSPPPLQIAVGASYRSEPGLWLPWGRPWQTSPGKSDLSTNPKVPAPTGLSPAVPRTAFAMDVRQNLLEDPYLAVPYPLVAADLAGDAWGTDYQTQSVRVAERPDSYTVSYWELAPTANLLRSAPALTDHERYLFDLDLRLDGPYVGTVTTLTNQLTNGVTSAYDKAMAIQQYLRADGGFTYSLTLAAPAKDRFGKNAGFDALTNFLITKQGYCVQFATAMVMMSRAAGIPARMALGFLPGTQSKGVWTVIAADAHAWPELYLDGIGWTRFEPTPSRGAPPAYAVPATSPGTAAGASPQNNATAPVPGRSARKDQGATSTGNSATKQISVSPASVLRWLTHGWGAVLFLCLAVALGLLLVPTAARWRRRRSLTNANTAAERVEVEWELLTSSLGDLGIPAAPCRTPRQQRAYYDREAFLEGDASQALGRVVQTLERSRYAMSSAPPQDLSTDARLVFRAAAQNRVRRNRLRAAMWPSSGVIQLRLAAGRLTWRIRTPLRHLRNVLHRDSMAVKGQHQGDSLKDN
jgi:transglutaminase-like putative cysteine protease